MTGARALTHRDDGTALNPTTPAHWQPWVSAGRTRNFLLHDTLVDWLDLYGVAKGFSPDVRDPRTDFTPFIFAQGLTFETEGVIAHLCTLTPITTIATDPQDARSLTKAEDTVHAMARGDAVIYQGVLRDPEWRTYGIPDLLVRSDVLNPLFPYTLAPHVASRNAPALGTQPWHYVVVDIKFTTLNLLADWGLGNGGSSRAFKGQLYLYTRALGRLQGVTPDNGYLIGRSWRRGDDRGTGCMDLVAPASQHDATVAEQVQLALDWVRRCRRDGRRWDVLPRPTIPELRPNLKAVASQWLDAKKTIGEALKELTGLWYVGHQKRLAANGNGIERADDPRVTAHAVGVHGAKTSRVLQAILDINDPAYHGPVVGPQRVTAMEACWRPRKALEFYVDFETVSSLDDSFASRPAIGGQPLIYMIGCGHMEQGRWQFRCFIVDALTEPCEEEIIDAWLRHMRTVQRRIGMIEPPMVFHWSHAERSTLDTGYNSASFRRQGRRTDWAGLNWFDLWSNVARAEPVVIRGCQNLSLKSMAKALHAHGLIRTTWTDGPTDGLGTMVGAWWCAKNAGTKSMARMPLMLEIKKYNEVDCKVMMEFVRLLRREH